MKIIKCLWSINAMCGSWPDNETGLEDLSPTMRRRLSPLGQKAIQVVNACTVGLNDPTIPWIISCRHGDKSRRFNLLSSLAHGEMLSPSDFSMSVHNAIIGMFSIATGNKQTHSALAGGINSFEMGLLETVALQKEKGGSVGYIYYDYAEIEKLRVQFEGNADAVPIECFAMILGEGEGELNIEYHMDNNIKLSNDFDLKNLLTYLNNDEKKYSTPVGGGEILFERALSKT